MQSLRQAMIIHEQVRESLSPILPAALDIARRYGLPADYEAGHRPRHVAGNLSNPSEVKIILLLAEPGSNPFPEELGRSEKTWIEDITCDGLGNGGNRLRYDELAGSDYERNPRDFLRMVWPNSSPRANMSRCVITNSFWMQAPSSGGPIPAGASREFGVHLKRFLSVFANAAVVAAGVKAQARCKQAGIFAMEMYALTPPGSNHQNVRDTWKTTADALRRRLGAG
ncbi:MAG TPA: hypothetical protein VEH76_01260 [Methylocystis sp.]|nr:hypothetical protein [Methylocystis sp.]